jgi:hypothetical protein
MNDSFLSMSHLDPNMAGGILGNNTNKVTKKQIVLSRDIVGIERKDQQLSQQSNHNSKLSILDKNVSNTNSLPAHINNPNNPSNRSSMTNSSNTDNKIHKDFSTFGIGIKSNSDNIDANNGNHSNGPAKHRASYLFEDDTDLLVFTKKVKNNNTNLNNSQNNQPKSLLGSLKSNKPQRK